MKIEFEIDIPEEEFISLVKKAKENKPFDMPNLFDGKKVIVTQFGYRNVGDKLHGFRKEGEMTIIII